MKKLLLFLGLMLVPMVHATVTTQNRTVSYTCTGSTGPYAFTFPISSPAALFVTENGIVLPSTSYTMTPLNGNYSNGGSVTLGTPCNSGQLALLVRMTPITQTTVFTDNMPLPMKSFENGLDKLTEIAQDQASIVFSANCPVGYVLQSLTGGTSTGSGSGTGSGGSGGSGGGGPGTGGGGIVVGGGGTFNPLGSGGGGGSSGGTWVYGGPICVPVGSGGGGGGFTNPMTQELFLMNPNGSNAPLNIPPNSGSISSTSVGDVWTNARGLAFDASSSNLEFDVVSHDLRFPLTTGFIPVVNGTTSNTLQNSLLDDGLTLTGLLEYSGLNGMAANSLILPAGSGFNPIGWGTYNETGLTPTTSISQCGAGSVCIGTGTQYTNTQGNLNAYGIYGTLLSARGNPYPNIAIQTLVTGFPLLTQDSAGIGWSGNIALSGTTGTRDYWNTYIHYGTGYNPTTTLTFAHGLGTSGQALINMPYPVSTAGVALSGTTSPMLLNGSAGTAGQVVTSAGPGATPTWSAAGGGGSNATQIQGYNISPTAPIQSATLVWDTSGPIYNIRQLTQDDILPGFSITSFVCGACTTIEIGATVTNPSFTASYSALPASANITNTMGINSPFALTTPFTSATVTGAFTQTTQTTATFTLTAIGTSTKTLSRTVTWNPRSFGGVGAASATSSVTASGVTAVLSNGAILANAGLNSTNVGQVFGGYNPSTQKIYILCIGGSHTFKDNVTGFSFAFNAPTAVTFLNVNGSTVTMYLYESTNLLTGTYSILVVS